MAGVGKRFSLVRGDLRDAGKVREALAGRDTVIHLAAISNDPTGDIDEIVKQKISIMPADLQKLLSEQDLVDVVEYLQTLKRPRSSGHRSIAGQFASGELPCFIPRQDTENLP